MSSAITAAVASTVVGGLMSEDDNDAAAAANEASADSTRLQAEIARDQWNRYKQNYEPLELAMIDEARNAGSATEYAQAAGDASAAVSSQFGKARDRVMRTPGLDLSSPQALASLTSLDLSQSAADATQQNVARMGVKDRAWSKKVGMLGIGRGLDTTAASSLGASAQTLSNLASNSQARADQTAGRVGTVMNRAWNSPQFQGWLGNAGGNNGLSNPVQAGSSNGNGSVQGNPDYIYDL